MCVSLSLCVHACVRMHACVRACVHICEHVYALRKVSMDKILHFTNTLIIIRTLLPSINTIALGLECSLVP